MMYRALAPVHLFAPVIAEMELWEVGVLLGADTPTPRSRLILPTPERDPNAPKPTGPVLAEVD